MIVPIFIAVFLSLDHYLANTITATVQTNDTTPLPVAGLSSNHDGNCVNNNTISNATLKFIESLANSQVDVTPHLPANLLNLSCAFQPICW